MQKIVEFEMFPELNGGYSHRYGMNIEFTSHRYALHSHIYCEQPQEYKRPRHLEVEMRDNDKDFIVFENDVQILKFENWFQKYCGNYASQESSSEESDPDPMEEGEQEQ